MFNKTILWYTAICLFILGCIPKNESEKNVGYAFFVAGHTYGSAAFTVPGLHPPLLEKFDFLNGDPDLEFGIFAGDIVSKSLPEQWDLVDKGLTKLNMPVHFVPGNHDISDLELYQSRYGPYQYAFTKNSDLFIILDSNRKDWSFVGKDLEFLQTQLNEHPDAVNIFIISHHLVWVPGDERFNSITLNWPPLVPQKTNFWTEIYPLLQKLDKPVFWFAGDLGANGPASTHTYYREGQISLIGTGMGEGKKDNIVIARINNDHSVDLQLVALNGNDINSLGQLEDYDLNPKTMKKK